MDRSILVEITMKPVNAIVFRTIFEIRGKSKRPDETRIYKFVKEFLDDVGYPWFLLGKNENTWGLRSYYKRLTKFGSSFFLSKSLHEQTHNNSNTINATLTVSLPSNTPVCPNYDTDFSLLSEGIDSLEQFFDTQLQTLCECLRLNPIARE